MVPQRCPCQLPAESAEHERRINAVPRLWQDAIDCTSVRDLASLNAKVEGKGLKDGSSHRERASVSTDNSACDADAQAEDNGEERDETISYVARIKRAKQHRGDADEGEETDY